MAHENDYFLDEMEIVRWKSNARIPFSDVLDYLEDKNYITRTQNHQSCIQREKESAATIAEYKRQMDAHVYTQEELYEMRAAFGSGTSVVNILTGKRIIL